MHDYENIERTYKFLGASSYSKVKRKITFILFFIVSFIRNTSTR